MSLPTLRPESARPLLYCRWRGAALAALGACVVLACAKGNEIATDVFDSAATSEPSPPSAPTPSDTTSAGGTANPDATGTDATGSGAAGGQATGGFGGAGPAPSASGAGGVGLAGSGGTPAADLGPELFGSPLIFSPTPTGFGLSAAMATGDPSTLRLRLRPEGTETWGEDQLPTVRATDLAEWLLSGLAAGTRYDYQLVALGEVEELLFEGSAVTARETGASFSFALVSDTHIGAYLDYSNQGDETTMSAVSAEIRAIAPDFVMNLGDMLDFHQFGFNSPPPDGEITRLAYLNYRQAFGDTTANAAHFAIVGNWEGENGSYTPTEIARSRDQRLLYLPGPEAQTYPQGGSEAEDYYAFTWGDALFVVLNVMSYTPTEHLLSTTGGQPEDWTLGTAQLAWLESTLANASSKWRFLFIHHTVGGAAGNPSDSAYGRGGGQAAMVGEQAIVHQLMLDHGAQVFFYGHDHVFADMVVDDIHYSLPGSAGAIWLFEPTETGYTESWQESGWSRVDVTPDNVHVQFIALGGQVLHEYTLE